MKQLASIILTLAVTALGCSDDGASVGLSVRAVTSAPGAAATGQAVLGPQTGKAVADFVITDDGGAAYFIHSANLHLRHIQLDLPDGTTCADIEDSLAGGATCDGGSSKIAIDGPFELDLIKGTSSPSLSNVRIPVGTYKRIDFRVENDPNDVSYAVVAAFNHKGDPLILDVSLDFNEDIRIEDPNGVAIDEGGGLVAEFAADNWLTSVDIGSCIDDGDIRVDENTVFVDDSSTSGSCSGLEDTIKRNMKISGQLDRQ